jgi:RNA polymerase sigma-70 factor (ECF subfamily)
MERQDINEEECKWVIALLSGDVKAFSALYDRYHTLLYGFALRLSKNSAEAEDLVQNVFVAVWESRESIDVEKSFRSYLFSIARNRFYDMLRHKLAENRYTQYVLQQHTHCPEPGCIEQHLEEYEFDVMLNALLDHLPERRRQIFKMSRETQLSYRQIAQKLHITENTVDTQIRNVLNFLRKKLLKYLFLFVP